jgi:hypothetical protein
MRPSLTPAGGPANDVFVLERLMRKRTYTVRQLWIRALINGAILATLTKLLLHTSWPLLTAVIVLYLAANWFWFRRLRKRTPETG